MPKYEYTGTGPCKYGTQEVKFGDIVDASAQPGKNFKLVEQEPAPPTTRRRKPQQDEGE